MLLPDCYKICLQLSHLTLSLERISRYNHVFSSDTFRAGDHRDASRVTIAVLYLFNLWYEILKMSSLEVIRFHDAHHNGSRTFPSLPCRSRRCAKNSEARMLWSLTHSLTRAPTAALSLVHSLRHWCSERGSRRTVGPAQPTSIRLAAVRARTAFPPAVGVWARACSVTIASSAASWTTRTWLWTGSCGFSTVATVLWLSAWPGKWPL